MKTPSLGTLPVELARYTGMEGQARTGPLAAASFIATIPSLILFGIMRKWFSGGLLERGGGTTRISRQRSLRVETFDGCGD